MKTTAEDEGEEGREGGYTGEEEERNAASSGVQKKRKWTETTGAQEEVCR